MKKAIKPRSPKTDKIIDSYEIVEDRVRDTYVVVVAHSKCEHHSNELLKISCKHGLPITGYTYDSQSDAYHVRGADYLHLGLIPVSFRIKMVESSLAGIYLGNEWNVKVPVPEAILIKYLDPLQEKELRNFKSKFPDSKFDYQYLQMVHPN